MGPKELPVVKEEEEDEEEEEEMETVVIGAPEEKWDCETIISEFNLLLTSLINLLQEAVRGAVFTFHPTISSSTVETWSLNKPNKHIKVFPAITYLHTLCSC